MKLTIPIKDKKLSGFITLRLPIIIYDKVSEIAKREQTTLANVVRTILIKVIDDFE